MVGVVAQQPAPAASDGTAKAKQQAAAEQQAIDDLLPTEEDLLYEEELLRNPYSLKMWTRYIEARQGIAARRRYVLYERALRALPGSYKLWAAYLGERRLACRGLKASDPQLGRLNDTYERALVSMHKMPRIWTHYLELLMEQRLVTRTRRTFDRALQALPITQHDRVWQLYLKFVMQPGIPPETAMRVYRRYLQLEPTHVEEYIAYLKIKEQWGEAAARLAEVVNDELFRSLEGKSKHTLWLELADICTRHPREVAALNVEAILRAGIRKFTDEVGRLWTSLADYFIRQGLFEKARDVYEEGLTTVVTVRDFSLIFDALTTFEESLLAARMGAEEEEEEAADGAQEGDDGADFLLSDPGSDVDLRLARLEHLMGRRPVLLSSVMLRQNPHNVHEWHKRARLFAGQPHKQVLTYTEAVKTVDPDKAIGKLPTLWCAFAKFYDKHGDLPNARIIFEKATEARFKYVDDLASIWCEAAELELSHKNFRRALELMRRATTPPAGSIGRRSQAEMEGPVQGRLYRSLKLWSFYCDLEESLGTLESARAVYDQILDLRIATPQIVLNYALFLEENKHFEDAFQAYEKGVALFKHPHSQDIWTAYLSKFVARYGGKKLERARDLFRHALRETPPKASGPIFLQFAALEEEHGLARAAMGVYDQAVRTVPIGERLPIYDVYLKRASDFFGIGKVREIYEMAVEAEPPYSLTDADCKTMCVRYAQLETRVGEVDRARAIYVHASSLSDPRADPAFWSGWNDFEVKFGNEDTFREMLRIKRSVAASFSQLHFNTAIIDSAATAAAPSGTVEAGVGKRKRDEMAELEGALPEAAAPQLASGTKLSGFVSAGVIQQQQQQPAAGAEGAEAGAGAASAAANPEDIELDEGGDEEDDDDESGDVRGPAVVQQAVPDAVFGTVAAAAAAETGGEGSGSAAAPALGALDRFKRRKASDT